MRELTACFVILCLALASGAPANKENKIYVKNYHLGDKDVIYSVNYINKDELLYAVCEGSDADKKCKVYLESTDQNANIVHSCDVNLKYTKPYWKTLALHNTGYNKIVFIVKDGQNSKFINVNLTSCDVKEVTIDLTEELTPENPYPARIAIAFHENNYDVIFSNRKLCQGPLCKTTFDYDGNIVKTVSGFDINGLFGNDYYMEINNGYLFKLYNNTQSKVYLLRNGELDDTPLFVVDQPIYIATATDENKIGFCNYTDNKLLCKQYDAEGKNKIFEAEATLGDYNVIPLNFDMLNLEKGLLTVMIVYNTKDIKLGRQVSAVYFDEHGKQGKVINVDDLKLDDDSVYYLKLYKNAIGESCVFSIFFKYQTTPEVPDNSLSTNTFSRSTRCFTKDELV